MKDIILPCVRWYVAYPCSDRHVEELLEERGVELDHAPLPRWVLQYSPPLEEEFSPRQRPVGRRWRMEEPSIRVKGAWRYLSRAVDQAGQPIDFLLTEHRDTEAALRFLTHAIRRHGMPERMPVDGSEANAAAITRSTEAQGTHSIIRQVKYLTHVVAQDHRAVKRVTRPMLGCKSFDAAQVTLAGMELMHMLKKQQMMGEVGGEGLTAAQQFYVLAA